MLATWRVLRQRPAARLLSDAGTLVEWKSMLASNFAFLPCVYLGHFDDCVTRHF